MGASATQSRAGLVSKKQRRKGQAITSASQTSDDCVDSLPGAKVGKYGYPETIAAPPNRPTTADDLQREGSPFKDVTTGMAPSAKHMNGKLAEPDPSQLWRQINECLDGLCGQTVVEQLLENGHSELLAQRACLEVFHSHKHVNLEAAEEWIRTQGPTAPNLDELVKPEDRSRYQDIALAVAKVACLYSNAGKEASKEGCSSPLYNGSAHVTSSSFCLPSDIAGGAKLKITSSTAFPPGSPHAGTGTSAKKALKLLKASGKDGRNGVNSRTGEINPQDLLKALPPQVWTSLQESAGEVLTAMASAVDKAMDHGHLASSTGPASAAGSSATSGNVTCIAMPVPLAPPTPPAPQMHSSPSPPPAARHRPLPSTTLPPMSPTDRAPEASAELGSPQLRCPQPQLQPPDDSASELEVYKAWAETKIALMLQRLREAERLRREEAMHCQNETSKLRKDKEALEVRMAEYGAGLVKLKEASFQDAAARRDGQRALQAAHAELKGSALREQEVAAQALQATAALKAERKRTCAAEKQLKAANEAKAEAVAAAAKAAEEAAAGSMELDRARRLSEERAALVVQAENAAVEARQQCDVQVTALKTEREQLRAQVQELMHALAAAKLASTDGDAAAAQAAAEIAQLQGQLLAAQQVVAESLARGTHSRSASQASDPSNGCYDHWSGNRIFEADPGLSSAFGLYSGVFGPHHLVSNHSRRSSPASTGGADLPTWGQVHPEGGMSPLWGTPRGNSSQQGEAWQQDSATLTGQTSLEDEELWAVHDRLFAELPKQLSDMPMSR